VPREKPVTDRALRLLRARGGVVQKNHGGMYSGSGRPDIEGGYRGRHVLVETKSATGVLSPIQRAVCWAYAASGSYVCVAAGEVGSVAMMLDRIDGEIGAGKVRQG